MCGIVASVSSRNRVSSELFSPPRVVSCIVALMRRPSGLPRMAVPALVTPV